MLINKIWIENPGRASRAKGIAEIYVEGGALSYIKKTCIGRIYKKHLSEHAANRIISEIEKALSIFSRLENSEISANAEKTLFSERDIVYIAGPMTGKPLFNYIQFFGIAGLIEKEYGCRVLNPARQPNGLPYAEYIERALADVRSATAILLLTGWESSPGARKEFCLAAECNIRIIYEAQLADELKTRIYAK